MTTAAKRTRTTINLTDLTLGELDTAEKLREEGCGRIAAFVVVHMRRTDPSYTVEQASALTMRDVSIVEDDPDDEDDDRPTSAP